MINEWWLALPFEQQVYYGIALVSTMLVFVQLAAMMFGVGADELADAGDVDMDGPEDHASGLALLSSRTVFAFFVGFGWTGAIAVGEGHTGIGPAFAATAVGMLFGGAIVRLMGLLHSLRDSGTLDYANALGEVGTVYLEVHPHLVGGGQLEVMIQGRLQVVRALTRGGTALRRGAKVTVVELMDQGTLVVEPVIADRLEE